MAQYKYQLKQGHTADDTFIPGVRISKEGVVESNTRIESPVLELVEGPAEAAAEIPAAPVQAVAPQQTVQPVAAQAPQVITQTETKEQQ